MLLGLRPSSVFARRPSKPARDRQRRNARSAESTIAATLSRNIERGRGAWAVVGRTAGWMLNDLQYEILLRFRNPLLPLIGWPCPGARLAEAIPQARDALTSPDGHFAVVLETNAIATATVRDGQLYEIT